MPAAEAQAPTRHVAPKLKRRRKKRYSAVVLRAGYSLTESNPPRDPSHAQRCRVHRISSRVRDDRDTPPVWDETAGDIKVIWVAGEREYFCLWDSTGQITPNLARRADGFLDMTSSDISMARRNLTRRANHWHVFILAAAACIPGEHNPLPVTVGRWFHSCRKPHHPMR
jgi:hypothetical protein